MTSSVDSHTIPPFYACYLMRSYATNSSCRTYIGSTPDPIRRKKQHNGILTQGAHKTKRGRPWETQMIVWGFPSKIAALQFEWAWQKPYLSRHLRTHRTEENENKAGPSSTPVPHVALPIFTDTPKGQVITSADGCTGLSTHSVQSCMLVARALLRSEPFSAWGLRVTFFEEYCWAAWTRLEAELAEEFSKQAVASAYITVGLRHRRSRLGRPLPANHLSPAPSCDFSGVDGSKTALLSLTEEEKKALKLGDEKPAKEGKKGRSPGQWPEKLAQSLTVKAMGTTWKMLKEAPQMHLLSPENDMVIERDSEPRKSKWSDDNLGELSWQRYLRYLETQKIEWQELRGSTHHKKCYLCHSDVKLQDHLSYSSCPSPFLQLQPRPACGHDTATPALSKYGFHVGQTSGVGDSRNSKCCDNIFHISCLARHFSKQSQEGTTRFVLPTQGCCPCCSVESREEDSNTWVNIIRSVYRRKERLEREYLNADAVKVREEKLALKASTKKRPAATKPKVVKEMSAEISAAIGLMDALNELQKKATGKRGTKQVVSALLRDPIQPKEVSKSSQQPAKRAALLCSLDNLLNVPSQDSNDGRGGSKRSRSVSSNEVIDLT